MNENLNFYKLIERFRPNASEDEIENIKRQITEYAISNKLSTYDAIKQRLRSRKRGLTLALLMVFIDILQIKGDDYRELILSTLPNKREIKSNNDNN